MDVTATVQKVYGVDVTPLSGTTVYLFTEAGSYIGVSATTDGSGQAVFSLPAISYKIRADHLSQQYWSAPFVQTDVSIEVPYSVANVHVTDTGADVAGVPVYVFNGSSSYLGIYGTTDTYGIISFDLPAGTYRFRADVSGSQYWTDAVSLIAHQENQVDMPLDLLALTRTPAPGKIFHGEPPKAPEIKKHAKDPVLLASIGSLSGILANLSQTQLPGAVYYFINDHLGTPAKVVDDDGTVVWDADYLPFGETNILTGTYDNKFRFPGQYLDDQTGWHYNYHRYYSPGMGRYLRPDPFMSKFFMNGYEYALNHPLKFFDPLGLFECNSCSYCPSGKWDVDQGFSGSFVAIGGATGNDITFTCLNNNKKCKGKLFCGVAGLIVDFGVGWIIDFYSVGGGRTISGRCEKYEIEDYITSGWVVIAPLKFYGSTGSSDGNSVNVGAGFSGGVGYAWCHTEYIKCD